MCGIMQNDQHAILMASAPTTALHQGRTAAYSTAHRNQNSRVPHHSVAALCSFTEVETFGLIRPTTPITWMPVPHGVSHHVRDLVVLRYTDALTAKQLQPAERRTMRLVRVAKFLIRSRGSPDFSHTYTYTDVYAPLPRHPYMVQSHYVSNFICLRVSWACPGRQASSDRSSRSMVSNARPASNKSAFPSKPPTEGSNTASVTTTRAST